MMIMRFRVLSVLILSVTFFFVGCDSNKINLKFNPIAGKTYKLKQFTEQKIKQTMMGKEENVENKTTMILSFFIKNKELENSIIDVSIDKITYEMTSEKMRMQFDSDNGDPDNMIARIFSGLIGKKLTLTIAPDGEILSVEGSEAIYETIVRGLSVPDEASRMQLRETLNQVIGEKAFKGNMGMITHIFPEKPVSVGGKWKNSAVLEQMVPTDVENTWELKNIHNGIATIMGNSTITADNVAPIADMTQMPTTYDLHGTQTATVKVEEFTGWIIAAQMNSTIKGRIIIDKNPQAPQGLEIPLEFTTLTKYETIKM